MTTPRTARRSRGHQVESWVAEQLSRQGLILVEKNFTCRVGEIDLVMRDDESIVFIEVKYRQSTQQYDPVEAVTWRKQRRLIRASQFYLLRRWPNSNPCVRYDVVGVIEQPTPAYRWIKAAFNAFN